MAACVSLVTRCSCRLSSVRSASSTLMKSATPVAVTRAGDGAALSPRQRREQRAQFLVHLAGLGEGLGNLVTQQFAVALAQAVDGHAQGAFVHAELLGRFAVGNCRGADREEALRLGEQLRLAVAGTFRRQDG